MTNTLVKILFSLLPPLIGIFFDAIKSRERSNEILDYIKVCESDLSEQINSIFKPIAEHYSSEISRIARVTSGDQDDFTIEDFSVKDYDSDLTVEKISTLREVETDIKRLEFARTKIKVFRWVFLFVLVLGVGISISIWRNPNFIPSWLAFLVLIVSFLTLLLYFFDIVIVNNLMDDIRSKYEV